MTGGEGEGSAVGQPETEVEEQRLLGSVDVYERDNDNCFLISSGKGSSSGLESLEGI